MLIAIIGENCVGKSTLAEKIKEKYHFTIYSGKDYLRLEKNPINAENKFKERLLNSLTGENILYIIADQEHLKLLPEGTMKIVVTAEIEVIKERFRRRMNGNLPKPVELMLEKKHGMYDQLPCDLKINSDHYDVHQILEFIGDNI